MIRLNAKDDHVEVSITGSGGDIARELHALLDCIKNNESMQDRYDDCNRSRRNFRRRTQRERWVE